MSRIVPGSDSVKIGNGSIHCWITWFLRRCPATEVTAMVDVFIPADDEHIRREKAKARELRNSPWWKRRRSSGICHYCGQKFKVSELTMDHLIPLARGGTTVRANVVPACKDCNNKKKYLLPMEWEEYLATLNKEE